MYDIGQVSSLGYVELREPLSIRGRLDVLAVQAHQVGCKSEHVDAGTC